MLLLVKCKDMLASRILQDPSSTNANEKGEFTFEEVGELLFGKWGKYSVDVCLLSSQVGFCVVYVIFLGDSLHTLVPSLSKLAWMFIVIPILILECWVRDLKYLAPLSFIAVSVFITGFVIVLYYSISQPMFGKHKLSFVPESISSFATFVSITVFSFEGIGLVLPVQNAMKEGDKFKRIFISALATITLVYCLMGITGYVSWGKMTGGSIMDNIVAANGRTNAIKACNILFLIGGFCSYPLQMWPVSSRLDRAILKKTDTRTWVLIWKENAIRTGLVIFSLGLGLAIPAFSLFISLVGAVLCTNLAFIFPSLFHIKLFTWKGKESILTLGFLKDVLVLLFGIFSMILCTIVAISNIITAAREGKIIWDFF